MWKNKQMVQGQPETPSKMKTSSSPWYVRIQGGLRLCTLMPDGDDQFCARYL